MNTKELILALAGDVNYLTQKDISHLPAGKEGEGCGGCTRSGLAIMAECAVFTDMTTKILKGESVAFQPGMFDEMTAKVTSKEIASEELNKSFDAFKAQIESMSEADLAEQTTAPWGEPMPKAKLAAFTAAHTFYHDGQLNYIQAIHGDDQVHWME
ncbi:MAG: DinB family protein [Fimbriimonadaceae bacterium]|nr:DinB family protein [Fimbriimonadaceae bacterium]